MKVFATVVSGGKIAQSNEMCKHDGGSGVQNPSKNCQVYGHLPFSDPTGVAKDLGLSQ